MRIAGLVLAGGRSRRFGSEKATAPLDGRPLIAHVAAALNAGCERVAVNAPAGSGASAWAAAVGVTLLPDPPGAPDGPLAGVREGLRWAEREGFDALATAPCDTPRLPLDLVTRLTEALGRAPAAFARTAEGPHPLCALWTVSALPRVEAALADGAHPAVRALLASWAAAEAVFDDPAAFANANTPADLPADLATPAPRDG